MVKPLGRDGEGNKVSELAAFCIHPSYRGSGRGDSMLDYLGKLHTAQDADSCSLIACLCCEMYCLAR